MGDKNKLLFEDVTVQGNRWQQDPSGKTQNSRHLTLLDLVRMSQPDEQHPNNVPASQTPLHGTQMFTELLGDLYIQADQIEKAINIVKSSPVISDRSSSKGELEKMTNKCNFIKKLITSIGDDIDGFSVEKPVN